MASHDLQQTRKFRELSNTFDLKRLVARFDNIAFQTIIEANIERVVNNVIDIILELICSFFEENGDM
jgi:hypothetical protein